MYIFLQATVKTPCKCKIVIMSKRRTMFCTVQLYPECRESRIRSNTGNPDSDFHKALVRSLKQERAPSGARLCMLCCFLVRSFDHCLLCFGYGKDGKEQEVKIVFVGPASVVVSADRDVHLVLRSIFLVHKSSARLNCGKETPIE